MKTAKKLQLKTILTTAFALLVCFVLFAIFRAGVGEAEVEALSLRDDAATLRLTSDETSEESESITALRAAIAAFENADFTNGLGENETLNPTMPASSWGNPALYPEAGEHPRVGITPDMLTYIKTQYLTTAEGQYLLSQLVTIANSSFTGVLPAPSERTGSRRGFHNLDELGLAKIEARAFLYLLTGDEEYGYNAILSMKNYLSTLYIGWIHSDQCREFGRTMLVTAEVYDWCYDLLEGDDTEHFITAVTFIASGDASVRYGGEYEGMCSSGNKWMEVGYPPSSDGSVAGHTAEAQMLRDYLAISIAIYDENPSWYNNVAASIYNDFVPFRNYYYQSGMYPQGISNYWGFRYKNDVWSALLLLCATGESPYTDDMQRVTNTMFDMTLPDGSLFRGGDYRNNSAYGSMLHAAVLTAALYGDTRLRSEVVDYFGQGFFTGTGDKNYNHANLTTELSVVHHVICGAMYSQRLSSGESWDGTDIDQWDGSPVAYNSYPVGQMIARSKWNDENAPAVLMLIGEKGTSGHEHADTGTFQLFYKGLYTGDSGVYATYGQVHWRYYHQATVAHNGLLIFNPSQYDENSDVAKWYSGSQRYLNGSGNKIHAGYSANEWFENETMEHGTVTGHEYALKADGTVDYAYLAGDISKAYETETQATYVGRNMLTIFTGDPDYPMYFIVYDQIETVSNTIVNKFLLHTPTEPVVDQTAKTVTVTEDDARLVLHSLKGGDLIEPLGGLNRNYLINGVQCNSNGGTATVGSDGMWGRVEISNTGSTASEFFNVIYFTDATNDEKQTPVLFESGDYIGTNAGDDFVVFAKSEQRNTKKLSFTTEGGENHRYFVLGLHAGTWSVEVNGETVAQMLASEDGGMLTFYAPAGNVNIIPGDDIPTSNSELENYEKYGIGLSCGHELTYSHTHGKDGFTCTVTVRCEECGVEETKTLYSGEYNLSHDEFEREMAQSGRGEDVLVNSEFKEDATGQTTGNINGFAGATGLYKIDSNNAQEIVSVEDTVGNRGYYIKWQGTSVKTGEYLRWMGSAATGSAATDSAADWQSAEQYSTIGAAFVITFDFMWYGEGAYSDLFVPYTNSNAEAGAQTTLKCTAKVDENGYLKLYDNGAVRTGYMEDGGTYKLTAGEWVQLSFLVTPRGLNGVRDLQFSEDANGNITATKTADYDDGTYHVFVDGVHIASLNNYQYKTDLANSHQYNDKNFKANGNYYNSTSDIVVSQIRIGATIVAMSYDKFAIDDLRIYRGKLAECAHSETELGKCKYCGERVVGDCNLSADELATALGNNTPLVNTEFDNVTTNSNGKMTISGSGITHTDNATVQIISSATEGDTDKYLKWDATGGAAPGEYLRWAPGITTKDAASWGNAHKNGWLGAPFVITMDYRWTGDADKTTNGFMVVNSYTGNGSGTSSARIQLDVNVRVNAGVLQFKNGSSWVDARYEDGSPVALTDEDGNRKWIQITFLLTPRGLNGKKDVIYDEATGTYSHTADYDDNTYHAFVDGVRVATGLKIESAADNNFEVTCTSGNETYTINVNSLSDLMPYMIDFGQFAASSAQMPHYDIDDLRIYRGDIAECVHYDLNGNLNLENGICKGCGKTVEFNCVICERDVQLDGYALGSDVAVRGRNIELAESIEMHFFLELTEEIHKNEFAKVVITGAGGARRAEYNLSELVVLGGDSDAPGRYMVSLPLRSIDMASDVTVEVYVDGVKVGSAYTTTVYDYLDEVYKASQNDEEKALIVAMLNYGAYAQEYFAEENEDDTLDDVLPNVGYEADVTAEAPNLADYELVTVGSTEYLTDMGLVLSTQTKVKIYFQTQNVSVMVGSQALSVETVVTDGVTEYCVTLEGVSPTELSTAKTVTFTWSDGSTTTVTVSVYSVLKSILEDEGASEAFKNLAKAIYVYGEAANAYVNS